MSKVLITGAAGFIGSSVAEKFLAENWEVVGVDNFNDYYNPAFKKENAAALLKNARFVLDEGDISDSEFIASSLSKHQPDKIIHLAARAGVRFSIAEPLLYYQTNIIGTLNILEQAKKLAIKDIVFASSSSVYGNNSKVPFSEDDPVNEPVSPYATSKRSGELLCYTYSHLFGLNITALRFFSVYGPKGRPDMAPYLFTEAILRGQTIKKYGDGSMKRDWTYIDDIVEGVYQSVLKPRGFEIINLGNSTPLDLNTFIATIENACEKKAKIEVLPKPKEDVAITFADTKKGEKLLDFRPHTEFSEGMGKFVSWFKANRI